MSANIARPMMAATAAMPSTAPMDRPVEEAEVPVSVALPEAVLDGKAANAVKPKGSEVGSAASVLPIAVM